MTWDALQRELLAALGHTLYVSADAPALRVEEHHVPVSSATGREPRGADRSGSRDAAPPGLMRALLNAAGLGEHDAAILQSRLPPLNALSGNSGAKRTLWPTLRALRAQRRT